MEIRFKTPAHEAAQQIGILIIQGIQEELSGPRHGRWYPVPGNPFYDKNTYKNLPPQEKARINYHLKFVGAYKRDDIIGGAYQASAPGEPPASRTGRLRQSFFMTLAMLDESTYEVVVRTNVFYADDLEYGSESIDPRPFVEPALQKKLPEIVAIHRTFLYKVLRG